MNIGQIHALEYRLNNEEKNYPAFYHYKNLEKAEIFTRRSCEYFVYNKEVYRQVSTSLEDDRFVVYVEKDPVEIPYDYGMSYDGLTIEVRLGKKHKKRTMIHLLTCNNHEEVFSYLASDLIYIEGEEFSRLSAEVDQDRGLYVLYVKPTGFSY